METEYHKGTILCTKDIVAPGSGEAEGRLALLGVGYNTSGVGSREDALCSQ